MTDQQRQRLVQRIVRQVGCGPHAVDQIGQQTADQLAVRWLGVVTWAQEDRS